MAHIKEKSMSEFIFEQNINKATATTEFYCVVGLEDFLDDNNNPRTEKPNQNTLAKKIVRDDSSVRYSIKLSKDGRLYNPLSLYGEEKKYTLYDNNPNATKFKDVNFKCFDHYLNFLKTKNIAYFINAERESI